jgi:hypothetical protein
MWWACTAVNATHCLFGQRLQTLQIAGVQSHGAGGQTFFKLRMRQIALHQFSVLGHVGA